MKTKVKNTAPFLFIVTMMFLFAGFTWNENKVKEQEHQLIVDILSQEDEPQSALELGIFENRIIVLDGDGNTMIEKLLVDVENENLTPEEQIVLFNADFLMEHLGDKIYIEN